MLLNNIDHSVDAKNFQYQNMQQIDYLKLHMGKIFEVHFHKELVNI